MSRGGFTIIEVLVASTMIAVALLSALSAMGTSHQHNRLTAERDQAVAEIVRQIEILQQLRASDVYDRVAGTSGYTFAAYGLSPVAGSTLPGLVTLPSGTLRTATALRLTFTVSWRNALGDQTISIPYTHIDR